MPASCLVPGCTNKITGRGLCATHYAWANAARMFETNKERPPFTAEELAQLAATPVQPRASATARSSAVAVGQRQGTASGAKEGAEQPPSAIRVKLAERLGLPAITPLATVMGAAIDALATQEHMITEARQRLDEVAAREGHLRRELEQVAAGAVEPVAPTIGQAGSLQRQLAERLGLPPTTMSETVSKAGLEALEALEVKIAQLTGQADDDVRVCAGALSQIAAALGVESGDPEAIEAAALALSQKLAEAEAIVNDKDKAPLVLSQIAAALGVNSSDAGEIAAAARALLERMNGIHAAIERIDGSGRRLLGRLAGLLDTEDITPDGVQKATAQLVYGLQHVTRCYRTGERRYVNEGIQAVPALVELVAAIDGYRDRCVESARRWLPWEPLDEFLRGSCLTLRVRRVDGVYHFEAGGELSRASMATLAVTHPVLDEGLANFLRAGTATFVPLGER